jgi:glycosyltransferase involved in cell wall biosynthesis
MTLIERKRKHNLVFMIDGLGWGGAERLMVPILSSLDKSKFEFRVCVLQNKNGNPVAEELRSLGILVDTLPIAYLRDISALKKIKEYLQSVDADLLHAQLEFSTILGGLAAKQIGIPTVVTLHTIPSEKKSIKLMLHQFLEDIILRYFFDKVICVSEETQRFYLKNAGIDSKKSLVLYNGIDITAYSRPYKNRLEVLSEFNIPINAKVLTTVAVLREPKGIQYMIRAMPSLITIYPDIYYLIVGDGEYIDNLRDETVKANISSHVVFAGNRKDIPDILFASDLFVLPSLNEALPTVLAEAMAASLPILATNIGGIPEMIQVNLNGRLVPPANSQALANECISFFDDIKFSVKMGKAGRKMVGEKFNIENQIKQLQDLYIEVLTNRKYDID